MSRELNSNLDFPAVTTIDGTERIPLSQGGARKHATPLQLGRIKLTAATTYYISTTGSDDTGDGLSGSPWATIQYAVEWIAANIDSGGKTITLQLADGTYDGLYLYDGNTPANTTILIVGNTGNKSAVTIRGGGAGDSLIFLEGAGQFFTLYLNYLTLQYSVGYNVVCWYANKLTLGGDPVNGFGGGGGVNHTGVGPGASKALVDNGYKGSTEIYGSFTIDISSGSTGYFANAYALGYFYIFSSTVTVTALTVSAQFLHAGGLSYSLWRASSVTGTVTGTKYLVESNSVLEELSTVPGSVAGSTATGGQVV